MVSSKLRSPVFLLALCVYGYAAFILLACGLMWLAGDWWWLPTLLLFGPRWVLSLPLVVLVPAALAVRWRWLLPLGLCAVVIVWPIMGLRIPWRTLGGPSRADLRVMTYNVNRWAVSNSKLTELLELIKPDLVAVQECRRWHAPEGWHLARAGELLVISAHPIVQVEISYNRHRPSRGVYPNGLYCVVDTPMGRIGFANIHLATPRDGLAAVLDRETLIDLEKAGIADARIQFRRLESEDIVRWLEGFPEPKIIAGDFNMPVESTIYRKFWREYDNAFNRAGAGFGYTKTTAILRRRYGTRIDHILTDRHWRAVGCRLGPDFGSDHFPLVAELKSEMISEMISAEKQPSEEAR